MFKKEITIKNSYKLIHLKKVNPQELFDLITANRDYLSAWAPWTEFTNCVEDTEKYITESLEMIEKDKIPHYGMYADSTLIGLIGLNKKDNLNHSANAGYWISQDYQNKGIVSDALKIIISIAFTQTDVNRIELCAGVENFKSQKVAQRCGFVKEGIRREGEKIKGAYIDLQIYSLLKREYKELPVT